MPSMTKPDRLCRLFLLLAALVFLALLLVLALPMDAQVSSGAKTHAACDLL